MENTPKERCAQGWASSSGQLDQLIGTSGPRVWGFLVCITALLIATCIWGVAGRLETRVHAAALCENGMLTCFVKEEKAEAIRTGMLLRVNGQSFAVGMVAEKPTPLTQDAAGRLAPDELSAGDWVVEVQAACDLPNGAYTTDIVTESIAPVFFITN